MKCETNEREREREGTQGGGGVEFSEVSKSERQMLEEGMFFNKYVTNARRVLNVLYNKLELGHATTQ